MSIQGAYNIVRVYLKQTGNLSKGLRSRAFIWICGWPRLKSVKPVIALHKLPQRTASSWENSVINKLFKKQICFDTIKKYKYFGVRNYFSEWKPLQEEH